MEGDEDIEIMDDLAGGHPHDLEHYASGGEDDWHSEGSEGDHDEEEEGAIIADNPLESIARALGGVAEDVGDVEIDDDDREDGYIDDEGDDDEDGDGDEDDEDMDDEDAMVQEDYDDDEGAFSAPWGWVDDGGDAPVMTRAQPRGAGGWFTLSSGAAREPPVFSKLPRPVIICWVV